jgi:head-tail adaptor
MRSARRFRKRIEIWQTDQVFDGFSGSTTAPGIKLLTTWADLRSLSQNKPYSKEFEQYGISNTELAVIVTVRRRKDVFFNSLNQYIKYNGEDYVIKSFPEDKNFDHGFITFIATKELTDNVTVNGPIDGTGFFAAYSDRVAQNEGIISSESCNIDYVQGLL